MDLFKKMNNTILDELKKIDLIMPTCATYIDDTRVGWCFHQMDIDIMNPSVPNPLNNVLDIPNTDPHPDWHELGKHTERG